VRSRAVAINPIGRFIQPPSGLIYLWLRHPTVLGYDVARELIATSAGIERFRVCDSVVGTANGTTKGHDPAEGAFQTYLLPSS
jgi:NADPH:quinone reductase-like Zn-dependent oxidoreductase